MEKVLTLLLMTGIFLLATPVFAYVQVKGHYRNGTWVDAHVRSNPNGIKYDNYSWKPSQGLYNASYGARGSSWDTPTWITDPYYYTGKSLYESGQTGYGNTRYQDTFPTYPSYSTYSTYTRSYIPDGAYSVGSSWYCKSGYKTIYDSGYSKLGCEKLIEPLNGYLIGETPFCNYGYYLQGDNCSKIPDNGYAIGSNIYCNYGYSLSGSVCVKNKTYSSYSSSNYDDIYTSKNTYSAPSTYVAPKVQVAACQEHASRSSSYSACSCNIGYAMTEKGFCMKNEPEKNGDICRASYGDWTKWSKEYDESDNITCICKTGYKWNPERSGCINM